MIELLVFVNMEMGCFLEKGEVVGAAIVEENGMLCLKVLLFSAVEEVEEEERVMEALGSEFI